METEQASTSPGPKRLGAISLGLALAGTALIVLAAWALQSAERTAMPLPCTAAGLACHVAALVSGGIARHTPMGKAGQVIAGVVLVLTFLGGLYAFVVGVAGAQDTSRDLILNTDQ
jgi:hypothetical protein